MLSFTLPVHPVPLSACFVNVARNGRKDSDRYKLWKRTTDQHLTLTIGRMLGTTLKPTVDGQVSVAYTVKRPDRRARDLDNLFKSLNDTLVRNCLIADDSNITDLRIKWADKEDAFQGQVLVSIGAAA